MDHGDPRGDRLQRAEVWLEIGRFDDALRLCSELLAEFPDDAETLEVAARAAFLAGDFEESDRLNREHLARDPEAPDGHALRGLLLDRAGKPREAEDALRRAIGLAPTWPEPYGWAGTIIGVQGRVEEGITVARKGLKQDPNHAGILGTLAWLYRSARDDEMASEMNARALQAEPEGAWHHVEIGAQHLRQGDRQAARQAFRESLRIDPNAEGHMEAMAHERAISLWPFRSEFFLSTDRPIVVGILLAILFWWGLSLLWSGFFWVASLTFVLAALGYVHLGIFRLVRFKMLSDLRRGRG